jgi:hypothetical protein
VQPAENDIFDVLDLYRYTAKTTLFIDPDSLPYLDGIQITDINSPLENLLNVSGIRTSFNPRNYQQNQNQNQS